MWTLLIGIISVYDLLLPSLPYKIQLVCRKIYTLSSHSEFVHAIDNYQRGDKVNVTISKFSAYGAFVNIIQANEDITGSGLILQQEIDYLALLKGSSPYIGDVLTGYVQNVRENGKVDISLRPVGMRYCYERK